MAGGDKVPRKGGPGVTQVLEEGRLEVAADLAKSDLLVINKTDLAEAVGADLKVIRHGS